MTDKAEMPDEIWASNLGGWWSHVTNAATTRYIRADLINAQAAKMEHMRVEIEMLRDHINTETKDYVRLRNTAAKSVHRKIALRQLNKAHEVACLTMELMARRLSQAQDHLRGDTP
jgi:uncharacterized protein (DUF2252 family)